MATCKMQNLTTIPYYHNDINDKQQRAVKFLEVRSTEVKPKLSDDPKRLHIVKGRHPLVEAASTAHNGFVSNSSLAFI